MMEQVALSFMHESPPAFTPYPCVFLAGQAPGKWVERTPVLEAPPPPPKGTHSLKCSECKKPFLGNSSNALVCSSKCRIVRGQRVKRERRATEKVVKIDPRCIQCGKPSSLTKNGTPIKYCSDKCREEKRLERLAASRIQHPSICPSIPIHSTWERSKLVVRVCFVLFNGMHHRVGTRATTNNTKTKTYDLTEFLATWERVS